MMNDRRCNRIVYARFAGYDVCFSFSRIVLCLFHVCVFAPVIMTVVLLCCVICLFVCESVLPRSLTRCLFLGITL